MKETTKKHRQINMTEGSISKQLILYVIPLIMGELFQQLYSAADIAIAGNFIGKEALAAIGATSTIVNTVIGFFVGFSTGATVVIGRYFGAKDNENLRQSVSTVVLSTVIIGIVISIIGILLTPPLLKLLNTPSDTYNSALIYLKLYFGGALGLVMYNACSGILRAVGDSKRPLYVLTFCAFLNIALDLLFIVVFKMGIAGAAIATVISQFISALVLIAILIKTKESYGISLQKPYININILKEIIRNGLPMGLYKSTVSLSNTVVIAYVNYFGSAAMAGWSIYRKVDQIIAQTIQGMSLATTTFVSQNIGAKKHDRIKTGVGTATIIALVLTTIMATVIIMFRVPLIKIFNSEPDVIAFGGQIIMALIPFQAINCISQIGAGRLRGYGKGTTATIIMLSTYVGLRQIYLYLGWGSYKTLSFVLSCYPISWAICAILFVVLIKAEKLQKV